MVKKVKVTDNVLWEMIIKWKTDKQPFIYQKLEYKAPSNFKLSYAIAVDLIKSLRKVGGFDLGDLRLVAIAEQNALEQYRNDRSININRRISMMRSTVREIKQQAKPTKLNKKLLKTR